MTDTRYQPWGRLATDKQQAITLKDRELRLPASKGKSFLPFGNGRSYGDSCLNEGGVLLDCRGLNRLLHFDAEHGLIRCEAGMLLSEMLQIIVPAGWFLPVTPGTKFVTIGGAIANDVHGKNHHRRGTFGQHVTGFELLRSDGHRFTCSPEKNTHWFSATIGGMGLTGLITWAEIKLIPIQSASIDQDVVRFGSLGDFTELANESDRDFEYSVAWVDSIASGKALGRGLFIRGNHAADASRPGRTRAKPRFSIPFEPRRPLINRTTLKLFNTAYYRKQIAQRSTGRVPYDPFFYPLDAIGGWNLLYGSAGLFQHQSVLPLEGGIDAVREMLERTQRAGIGSFLTVLKIFGDATPTGLMSFPKPGFTLTLDFSNEGAKTLTLLDGLDAVVRQAKGRVNPYKDARMSAESFQAFFPHWRNFEPFIDPAFSSSFWRRVTKDTPHTPNNAQEKARKSDQIPKLLQDA